MAFRVNEMLVLVLLFAGICVMVSSHGMEGGSSHIKRAEEEEEEDLELERQLKILNKPAIKSIQSEYGDIFDCVDIYKQPAFDHHLLKNHKLQMIPSSVPKGFNDKSSSTSTIGLMSEDCPQGTIPIRRVQKEELKRATLLPNYNSNSSFGVHSFDPLGISFTTNVAATRMQRTYYGAKAKLNVYAVPNVTKNRFSASEICVTTGFNMPDAQINTIQAGWMVQPNLFGDSKTRFYSFWTGNGNTGKGCYNLLCPGFVQISKSTPMGIDLHPLSDICGDQYVLILSIFQDSVTKNWWLYLGVEPVGYFPPSLFGGLADHASELYIGGSVSYPTGERPTAMGNGYFIVPEFPYPKCKTSCFASGIQFLNEHFDIVYPSDYDLEPYADSPDCFKVSTPLNSKFYFGGPDDSCDW